MNSSTHNLVNNYLLYWRPSLAAKKQDENDDYLFLTMSGGKLETSALDSSIKETWPLKHPKFGFTNLRKTSHTAYDEIAHERANDHLFYSGANHTWVFIHLHFIELWNRYFSVWKFPNDITFWQILNPPLRFRKFFKVYLFGKFLKKLKVIHQGTNLYICRIHFYLFLSQVLPNFAVQTC